jgi:predicted DNA-binding transcriptional regulator AlpA
MNAAESCHPFHGVAGMDATAGLVERVAGIGREVNCPSLGEDDLLTSEQLALICRCSARHIANMRKRGALPRAVRCGALVRYRVRDVRQWLANGGSRAR